MGVLGTTFDDLWIAGDTSMGGHRGEEYRSDDGGGGEQFPDFR